MIEIVLIPRLDICLYRIIHWIHATNDLFLVYMIIYLTFHAIWNFHSLYLILLFRMPSCFWLLISTFLFRNLIYKFYCFNFFYLNCLPIRINFLIIRIFQCCLNPTFLYLKRIKLFLLYFLMSYFITRWVKYHFWMLRMRWLASILFPLTWFLQLIISFLICCLLRIYSLKWTLHLRNYALLLSDALTVLITRIRNLFALLKRTYRLWFEYWRQRLNWYILLILGEIASFL